MPHSQKLINIIFYLEELTDYDVVDRNTTEVLTKLITDRSSRWTDKAIDNINVFVNSVNVAFMHVWFQSVYHDVSSSNVKCQCWPSVGVSLMYEITVYDLCSKFYLQNYIQVTKNVLKCEKV